MLAEKHQHGHLLKPHNKNKAIRNVTRRKSEFIAEESKITKQDLIIKIKTIRDVSNGKLKVNIVDKNWRVRAKRKHKTFNI